MNRIELTFAVDIDDDTLRDVRTKQSNAEFGVEEAMILLHDNLARNANLIYVADDN